MERFLDAVGDTTPSDVARDDVGLVDASLDGTFVDVAQVDGGDARVADGAFADVASADANDAGVGDSDAVDAPADNNGSSEASCACLQAQPITWQSLDTFSELSGCRSYATVVTSSPSPASCPGKQLLCQEPLLAQLNSKLSQFDAGASGPQTFFDQALTAKYLYITFGTALFELVSTCSSSDASCPTSPILAGIASTLLQIDETELASSPCSSNESAEAGEAGMSDAGQD